MTEHVENGLRAPRVRKWGKLPEEVRALAVREVGVVARARERVAREFD
ncbi:hypothetical protein [Actinosynnema sp.]